ncbi:MAG: GSCFA domain-containing protein [Bacteroidales bacterium]|nr:GSCFA domain-containing protein [Bacteroidales bacterium]
MEWQTKVAVEPLKNRFSYASRFLFTGSCFAQELAEKMQDLHFQVAPDAFGALFNPASIVSALERLEGAVPFNASEVRKFPYGAYGSFSHHTLFSKKNAAAFLEHANARLQETAVFFEKTNTVILTLGTAWVYLYEGKAVANCHKLPGHYFERVFLEPEQIVDLMTPVLQRNLDKLWVLTVSPVRHLGEGAHGNQLSKASLLLATEYLQKLFDNIYYFPSYEIVMDQLRDYRFYGPDRCHLTQEATNYILKTFIKVALDENTIQLSEKVEKLNKSLLHKPFLSFTEEHALFVKKLDKQRDKLLKTIANKRNL